MRRAAVGAAAVVTGAVLWGCDPCAGAAACGPDGPRLSIAGQIVEAESGRGVDGVTVDVVRTGGIATRGDSARVVTRGGGHWQVSWDAEAAGLVETRVRVTTANGRSYAVPLVVRTVERAGDATLLPRWVATPYYPYYLELFYRGTPDERAGQVTVRFDRTAGARLESPAGVVVDQAVTGTDPSGRAQFFLFNLFPTTFEPVVGDVVVDLGARGASVRRGVSLEPTHLYRADGRITRVGVGPNLDYVARVYRRVDGVQDAGARYTFTRTGGVPIEGLELSGVAAGDGSIKIRALPLAAGVLEGTLTITTTGVGAPETIPLRLPTYDADTGRFVDNFRVGSWMPYYGFVRANGLPVLGATVDVIRTGGARVRPERFVWTVGENGAVGINPEPLDAAGDVTFELRFRLPAPLQSFTVRNLRLPIIQREAPSGVLVYIWDVDRGPSGPAGTEVIPSVPPPGAP